MQRFLVLAFLIFFWGTSFGQKLYPLLVTSDSISFQLKVQNGQLMLLTPGTGSFFQSKKGFPTLTALRLEGADLVLEYLPEKNADALSYNLSLQLDLPAGLTIAPLSYEISDQVQPNGTHRMIWLDAGEQLPDYSATYILHVRRSLMGAVNCDGVRPTFTLKKQLPHFAAGVIGLGLIGLGQVYRDQSKGYYSDYQQTWREGLPASDQSNSMLQSARDKDRSARICTWTGLAMVGIDALWYVWRGVKIKKKERVYDKFCGNKTSWNIRPVLSPGGLGIALALGNDR